MLDDEAVQAGVRRAMTAALAGAHARQTSSAAETTKLDYIIRRLDAVDRRLTAAGL
jgi:hypothetical protein